MLAGSTTLSNGLTGSRDISTSGLDTFNFPTSTIPLGTTQKTLAFSTGQRVFKVVGDKFIISQELIGSSAYCSIYNLNGKMVGRIPISNKSKVDLRGIRGVAKGVLVVKVER
jgi:hypothetical protein